MLVSYFFLPLLFVDFFALQQLIPLGYGPAAAALTQVGAVSAPSALATPTFCLQPNKSNSKTTTLVASYSSYERNRNHI